MQLYIASRNNDHNLCIYKITQTADDIGLLFCFTLISEHIIANAIIEILENNFDETVINRISAETFNLTYKDYKTFRESLPENSANIRWRITAEDMPETSFCICGSGGVFLDAIILHEFYTAFSDKLAEIEAKCVINNLNREV